MKSTTIMALVLGAQLAILHTIATKLSLYWEIVWFDNLMHCFGGVVLLFLLQTLVDIKLLAAKWVDSIQKTAFIVMSVLIGWEVLGVFLVGRIKDNFVPDTSLDIMFGIIGSIIGYFIVRALKKLEQI